MTLAILIWFLVVAVAIIAIMVAVAVRTSGGGVPGAAATDAGTYRLRRRWFAALVVVLTAAYLLSLPRFPYPSRAELAAQRHVAVVAEQYAFRLPATVPAGVPLIFDVTAKDVNHGFAIYDPQGNVVAQVQAMPGYVNHLPVVFSQRGVYAVRCLEYCGIGHAYMRASFEVR